MRIRIAKIKSYYREYLKKYIIGKEFYIFIFYFISKRELKYLKLQEFYATHMQKIYVKIYIICNSGRNP